MKISNFKGERKNLITNFLSLSVLQVLGYVFSLFTLPYLARVVGVENFGRITFSSAVVSYFICIVQWGFRYSAVRDIAVVRDDRKKVSRITSRVLCSSILLMLLSFVILFAITYVVPIFRNERYVILVTSLIIPGYVFFPDWLFQGMEEMKYMTIASLLSKFIFTFMIFLFITKPEHFILQPVFQAIGQIIPGLIAFAYGVKKFRLKITFIGFREMIDTLKNGFNVFSTQFMPTIYNQLSIVLLGSYCGQISVGVFSAAYKFIGISEQFSAVLSRTFFPFLARRIEKHKKFAILAGFFSLFVSVLLFVLSDIIIDLFFTEEFNRAKLLLKILSFGPFFLYLRNTYGMNGLVLIKKDSIYRNIVFVCSLLGFVLACLTIPFFDNIGVAVTFMVVWGVMGFISLIKYKKYKK